jgi:hypothetical protein
MLFGRHEALQLFMPVEDYLDLRPHEGAGLRLSRWDKSQDLATWCDVVDLCPSGGLSWNGLGSGTAFPNPNVGSVVTLIASNPPALGL